MLLLCSLNDGCDVKLEKKVLLSCKHTYAITPIGLKIILLHRCNCDKVLIGAGSPIP